MKKYLLSILIQICFLQAQEFDTMLDEANRKWAGVEDFTAFFHKKELVNGKIIEENNIFLKWAKPLKIYMNWTTGDNTGQEIIYHPEKYGKSIETHRGSWQNMINLSLDPEGSHAMKKSRHPIFDYGIGRILDLVKQNYQLTKKIGKGSFKFVKEEQFDNKKTYLFLADLPEDQGFYCKKILINLDKQTKLPLKITAYGFKNEFLEYYAFTNLKLNTSLSDMDFDMDNSKYKY